MGIAVFYGNSTSFFDISKKRRARVVLGLALQDFFLEQQKTKTNFKECLRTSELWTFLGTHAGRASEQQVSCMACVHAMVFKGTARIAICSLPQKTWHAHTPNFWCVRSDTVILPSVHD